MDSSLGVATQSGCGTGKDAGGSYVEALRIQPGDRLATRAAKSGLRFLEDRVRLVSLVEFLAAKPVPHDLNWSYTLGAVSLFLLLNQLVTGVLLALYYRPAVSEAFESIRYLEEEVPFGWLVRQSHAWGANLMILAMGLHMARVFWYGSYKRPREINWLIGVCLLQAVMASGFTGCLLPWDQLAYWASKVGTEIPAAIPGIGVYLQKLLRGGEEISGATLGRFFTVHTMVLPALIVGLVGVHLAIMRFHGISSLPGREDSRKVPFFPYHVLKDAISIYVAFAILYALVVLLPWRLHEKADPLVTPVGVKPEWYFLWTYQLLKYFPQTLGPVSGKVLGILLSGSLAGLLAFVPFLDRDPERRPAKRKAALAVAGLLVLGVLVLTGLGYVSGKDFTFFGLTVHFDVLGFPEAVKRP
ncbi:MAG: cytochrome bc complex cytochrome b subunit [Candidatus Riflebacteria bacterium]|nr:cytochrome bc complex cytochrome b subunit [Candidatus Riflebacteria bacterium]